MAEEVEQVKAAGKPRVLDGTTRVPVIVCLVGKVVVDENGRMFVDFEMPEEADER